MRIDLVEVKPPTPPAATEARGSFLAVLARSAGASFVLKRGALLPLPAGIGTDIRCDCGSVWITQDHDPRDIVLERGEHFVLDVDAPAFVQAFDFSVINVTAPPGLRPAA